ncbi:CaiB/BaiF CoA-transferase family protein [Saccharomonospora sp. NPDC046836]|uniref:CaiB/BaiF CoA transferase family protein n=1 Tax=Saccharomonospora sp. NPDC046836 TaxID=3156921 RepID=UPI0033FB5BE2
MLHNALGGVRVLDLSRIMAGPWCTQNLSDLGAEVIKVEGTLRGDDTRGWGPPFLDSTHESDGFSAYYISTNRGKRSIAVNFKDPAGVELLTRLARSADIVVENYRAGTLARHGLGYDDLRAVNERLIYLSITGFGQDGPDAAKPGYDYVFQGLGGLMSYTGLPDGTPGAMPMRTGVAVVDLMTGMYATSAVLAALHQREGTGAGQHIDLALLDVAVALNANQGANYLVSGEAPRRTGNAHPNCAPYEVFATSDGHMILAIGNDTQFEHFCVVAGLAGLASDPRFSTNAGRLRHMDELRPLLTEVIASRSRARWGQELTAAGVPWGPINTLDDVFREPQVRHRDLVIHAAHPQFGDIPMTRNPLVRAPDLVPVAPPAHGEHTVEVLRDARYTEEEIEAMIRSGAVRQATERAVI